MMFHDMVEGTVFIVNMKDRTARGIWKSPEQGEKGVDMARAGGGG